MCPVAWAGKKLKLIFGTNSKSNCLKTNLKRWCISEFDIRKEKWFIATTGNILYYNFSFFTVNESAEIAIVQNVIGIKWE